MTIVGQSRGSSQGTSPARPGRPRQAGVGHPPELWSTKALLPQLSLSALAVGSRVSQELHYTKEKLGEEAAYTSQMLIQTPRQEGENVLTPEALGLHLQAALTASKVQVSLYGK